MKEQMKSALSFLGRLALSSALLVWLFRYIDWKDIIRAVKMADWHLLGWAFAINCLVQVVCLVRWALLMKALNLSASWGATFRYFFIGMFCNLFLPTSIGGDVVKAIGMSRSVGNKPKVFASVLLDRLSGFGGLVVLALVAYLFGHQVIDAPAVMIPVLALTAISLAVGFMLFHDQVYTFCCQIFGGFPKAHKALMDMHTDVVLMKARKRTAVGCVAMSAAIQVFGAYMYYLIAVALGQHVGLSYFMVVAPIVCAVTFLPSIGGLGVRELGWVYFLGRMGVDKGIAASISLISFFFVIVTGVLGGVFYVTSGPSRRVQCSAEDAAAL
ncbi:MAG: flippase-like domain-containing protein [Candidatus Omnitrophica bacterium]|nr:flippase-like domain-containing protein [Candidatus Omnitrophota bacterium]MBF0620014.1 flippase-like domain-containing protein [Candidatus Omnitrophota bacterium]